MSGSPTSEYAIDLHAFKAVVPHVGFSTYPFSDPLSTKSSKTSRTPESAGTSLIQAERLLTKRAFFSLPELLDFRHSAAKGQRAVFPVSDDDLATSKTYRGTCAEL